MRNVLRRISLGALGTGMIVAMAAGVTTVPAGATVASGNHAAAVRPRLEPWPVVSQGAKGNRVRAIQYLLNQRHFTLTVDGDFGPVTKMKVMDFQRSEHVDPTGIVGDMTWPRLIVTVHHGDQGDAVRAVQDYLHRAYGFTSLPVTGNFLDQTLAAVRTFQARYGLEVDGIVGPVTWNTLVVKHD
jgi:peptidoglycan hydrolase-like protein with peptidoglycan-binding domain